MSTIVLEPTNDADAMLLLSLAHRLGVKATTTTTSSATENARLVAEFAGSWQSDEDGTELARQLREARYFRDREVEL